jgi:hypothetical protein
MVVSVVGGDMGGDSSNYLWRLRHNTGLAQFVKPMPKVKAEFDALAPKGADPALA